MKRLPNNKLFSHNYTSNNADAVAVVHKEPAEPIVKPYNPAQAQVLKSKISDITPVLRPSTIIMPESKAKAEIVHKAKHKAATSANDTSHEHKMTIGEHINELRSRLFSCLAVILLGAAIGYKFQDEIIIFLTKPLNQQLFYSNPAGGFDFVIKISLFVGFVAAIPFIIYNLIKFTSPALPSGVKVNTGRILLTSLLLAVAGIIFAYTVCLPAALNFLNQFSNQQIQSLISAQEYLNFVIIYLASFAALFQMPLIFMIINKVKPLDYNTLLSKQRIVILASFIVAALLTPTPDPINQSLMALPIIGLYQASIATVWHANKRGRRKQRQQTSSLTIAAA